MATWFSFTYRGQKFEAKATSRSTRSGFAHDVVIRDEDYNIVAQETRHYLNRTWESYRFESCLHGAINNLVNAFCEYRVEDYKYLHGIQRIRKEKRAELTADLRREGEIAFQNVKLICE